MLIFNKHVAGEKTPDYRVALSFDKRVRGRLRITLENQAGDAGIDIERGAVLSDGALLASEDGSILKVSAEPEAVSVAATDDKQLFARACYHVGNRHAQVQIGHDELIYLHDHVLDEMLAGLGLAVKAEKRPFDPENGAYSGSDHHAHTHAHDHAHEHEEGEKAVGARTHAHSHHQHDHAEAD